MLRSSLSFALALLLAPVPSLAAEPLHAYVGAGLRPPFDVLVDAYAQQTGVVVQAEYGGSGQLLARFRETGRGELFVAGSTLYTDRLAADGDAATVQVLAEHGAVVAVTPQKAGEIRTLADLAAPGVRVGLGDPEAMALGRTAEEILDASGLGDEIRANVVVRAATVKQLALYVLEEDVDAAILGTSEIAQTPGKLVAVEIPRGLYTPDYAAVAVLDTAVDPAAAQAFADFLASPEGDAVFAKFGFPPVTEE